MYKNFESSRTTPKEILRKSYIVIGDVKDTSAEQQANGREIKIELYMFQNWKFFTRVSLIDIKLSHKTNDRSQDQRAISFAFCAITTSSLV